MRKLCVMAETQEFKTKLEQSLDFQAYAVDWATNETMLLDRLKAEAHSFVILPDSPSYNVYHLCEQLVYYFPHLSVLLAFNAEKDIDMRQTLRAGASDVVFLTDSTSKIKRDIDAAIEKKEELQTHKAAQKPKKTKASRVITITSTKGGVGKTTLAVNLAIAFSKKMSKVAILDLDLQFGDVALFCDVSAKKSIYDWVKEDKSGVQIDRFLTLYKSGVHFLSAPHRPEFAEVITGDDVRRAIRLMREQFDIIIIDTSSHFNENTIVALENSDDILLTTSPELPALKNSKLLLETISSLKLSAKVKVIVNKEAKVKGITLETVEKVCGRKVFASLPLNEKGMSAAINEGNPICFSNPRSAPAKQLFRLASSIVGVEVDRNRKKKKQVVQARGHA
ncbi:AAA family ATPase [Virgibacillus sp. W0430]|uniref:AAA family ATPase n=1 Tax=Virgibacillus sp. W0430 TaxID=3391580 RepID=UPI003F470E33